MGAGPWKQEDVLCFAVRQVGQGKPSMSTLTVTNPHAKYMAFNHFVTLLAKEALTKKKKRRREGECCQKKEVYILMGLN